MRLNLQYSDSNNKNFFLLPRRATKGSCGYDIYAPNEVVIYSGEQKLIPLLFSWAPEPDPQVKHYLADRPWDYTNKLEFFAKMFDKSGLTLKFRFTTRAGVIDVDYRDPWNLLAVNESDKPVSFEQGNKIGQFVLIPFLYGEDEERFHWVKRQGGFGSTGA